MRAPRIGPEWGLPLGLLALVIACEGGGGPVIRFMAESPHQEYEAQLREVGLHGTALGRDWLAAAEQSVQAPIDVDVPWIEARFLDPARAAAVAYRVRLERGQRLVVGLDVPDATRRSTRFFLDLFFAPDSVTPLHLVAAADSSGWDMTYVALRPGLYVLRIQPELLRGGRVTVSIAARASLGFPVAGKDMAAIRSRFGASRDAGRREHQGVDIFAPRGTPVVAAVAGRVSRVHTTRLGGNVVWVREAAHDRRLYYAHLDRQAVLEDMWVEPGDTLGFVGNTGNARTTPPHLHFGIYMRGMGPVDPHFHLHDPPQDAERFAGDPALLGRWARIRSAGTSVRTRPDRSGPALGQVPGLTPVEVQAGTGRWYRTRLPDGREGYVALDDAEALAPLGHSATVTGTVLRADPSPAGAATDSIAVGDIVPVLGRFGAYALVQRAGGLLGWVGAGSLGPERVRASPGREAVSAGGR